MILIKETLSYLVEGEYSYVNEHNKLCGSYCRLGFINNKYSPIYKGNLNVNRFPYAKWVWETKNRFFL